MYVKRTKKWWPLLLSYPVAVRMKLKSQSLERDLPAKCHTKAITSSSELSDLQVVEEDKAAYQHPLSHMPSPTSPGLFAFSLSLSAHTPHLRLL